MSEITASKAEFALALTEAGLTVLPYIPARVTPPIVIMRSGSPYLVNASIGHEFVLGLELVCVAGFADNESTTEGLDQLIEDTINALPNYATMKGVSQPYALEANNATYLAADITTDLEITL